MVVSGAVIIELGTRSGNVKRFTVADAQTWTKGDLMLLKDPRTCSGATLTAEKWAGICSADKVANDGSTSLGLYTEGIFDLMAVGAITAGELVVMSGANTIRRSVSPDDVISGAIVGKALETASANEQIAVNVGVVC